MAHFLFVDESGYDEKASPYAVLAGISVEDTRLWEFIDAIVKAENQFFGLRYGHFKEEFKGKKFLKRKVFRHAGQEAAMTPDERRVLAHDCLVNGASATRRQITALAQAKLAFTEEVFTLARNHQCNAFASIVLRNAPRPANDVLRKDYSYLFERFYYFLEDRGLKVQGIVVFDELEKSQSKILLGQMEKYFLELAIGKLRARQIIPQPFFVHSDLTTVIQVADLIAYTVVWGLRLTSMAAPARPELKPFVDRVLPLRYRAVRSIHGKPDFQIWSFTYIDDLRGAEEKAGA